MQWVAIGFVLGLAIGCPWLIRRLIDPNAEIVYLPREEVLAYAEREGAISFDAPGARYTACARSRSSSRRTNSAVIRPWS